MNLQDASASFLTQWISLWMKRWINSVSTIAMQPIIRYPGAKWTLARWIIDHLPEHHGYLEPFFGSGAVFFNKPPAKVETINDRDGRVVNLFRVLRDHPAEICRLLELTPWARDEYEASYKETGDPIEDARRFIVRAWQSFGLKTNHRSGWAREVALNGRGRHYTSEWNALPDRVKAIAARLKFAQTENRPAVELIERFRSPDVLIYADPPYPKSTVNSWMYKFTMSDDEHAELLEVLDAHPGPVFLSTYPNEIYENRLGGGPGNRKGPGPSRSAERRRLRCSG